MSSHIPGIVLTLFVIIGVLGCAVFYYRSLYTQVEKDFEVSRRLSNAAENKLAKALQEMTSNWNTLRGEAAKLREELSLLKTDPVICIPSIPPKTTIFDKILKEDTDKTS